MDEVPVAKPLSLSMVLVAHEGWLLAHVSGYCLLDPSGFQSAIVPNHDCDKYLWVRRVERSD